MAHPVIVLKNVRKTFQSTVAVDDLILEINPGEVYGFLGPNGAGKTTTIRMLTGILLPDSGTVNVFGMDFKSNRREILNRLGYIPDRAYLYPKLTGIELLQFLGSLRKMPKALVRERAKYYLEMFELESKSNELIERYSHGMRQKLVLASALIHEPDLIIVDEPMVGLDPRAARRIKRLFIELAEQGKTVFMSTHSLDVAEQVCDRVGIIHKGNMVADDRPEILLEELKQSGSNDPSHHNPDLEAVFISLTEEEAE